MIAREGLGPIAQITYPDPPTPTELSTRVHLRRIREERPRATDLPRMQILTAHCTHNIEGGRDAFVRYAQCAAVVGATHATAWLDVYHLLTPDEQAVVNFDDICTEAVIDTASLMREIVDAAVAFGRDAANLLAASAQSGVVGAAVQSAKRTDVGDEIAHKDRKMLLDHAGFLPQRPGMTVNVSATATAQAGARAESGSFGSDMALLATSRQGVQETLKAETRKSLQAAFTDDE